jgi:hypothetical protein
MFQRVVGRLACLIVFLVSGCNPGQSDIEKSIREGMKSQMSVDITTIDIKKQSDGSYIGTCTASNGDVFDVTTDAPSGGKIAWKAAPGKAALERSLREIISNQLHLKVKSMNLTKEGKNYSGTADTEEGVKLNVSATWTGSQFSLQAVPIAP